LVSNGESRALTRHAVAILKHSRGSLDTAMFPESIRQILHWGRGAIRRDQPIVKDTKEKANETQSISRSDKGSRRDRFQTESY